MRASRPAWKDTFDQNTDRYQAFWARVGSTFLDLGGAVSTAYYPLQELKVLKTDLWEEARNTRILQWAARSSGCPTAMTRLCVP